jgi:hypothetical protein
MIKYPTTIPTAPRAQPKAKNIITTETSACPSRWVTATRIR